MFFSPLIWLTTLFFPKLEEYITVMRVVFVNIALVPRRQGRRATHRSPTGRSPDTWQGSPSHSPRCRKKPLLLWKPRTDGGASCLPWQSVTPCGCCQNWHYQQNEGKIVWITAFFHLLFPWILFLEEFGTPPGFLFRRQLLVGVLLGRRRLWTHAAHPPECALPAGKVWG